MTQDEIVEIEKLLSVNLEEVYQALGNDLSKTRKEAIPLTPKALIKHARTWLVEKRKDLAAIICPNKKIRALVQTMNNDKGGSRILLVCAIVDLISAALTNVSPITVSVLLVREGLDTLCPEYRSTKGN